MRIAPLGVWGRDRPPEELAGYAIEEFSLSHPNESCCHAVACYVLALKSLLCRPGDRVGAFESAMDWSARRANPEVRGWLEDVRRDSPLDFQSNVGFIRIAFVNAFQHLLRVSTFDAAIRDTLLGGGDTDTNAAIVGGLIGAAAGARAIPEEMKTAVLQCDTGLGRPRPEFLQARRVPELVEALLRA